MLAELRQRIYQCRWNRWILLPVSLLITGVVFLRLGYNPTYGSSAAHRFGGSAPRNTPGKLDVRSPFPRCSEIFYRDKSLSLMFDPNDRLFAMELQGKSQLKKVGDNPAGSKMTRETGLGIDFGASQSSVIRRFGKPDVIEGSGDISAYFYWVKKDGVVYLDKGFKLLGFHGGKLGYVSVYFVPFTLPGSVTYGESKSDVIKAYGKPQYTDTIRVNPEWVESAGN